MKKSRMDQSSSLGMPPRHPLIFIDYHKVVFVELRFYHPMVLSCKQQTFALSKAHEVSNTNIKRDINTAVLPLVAT